MKATQHQARRAAALICALASGGLASQALAQESAADLAKKLSNPVAALISVPLQLNYDEKIGPTESGKRWLLNVQPVVPITLNEEWNVVSRTILPVVSQKDIFPGAGSQSGIGENLHANHNPSQDAARHNHRSHLDVVGHRRAVARARSAVAGLCARQRHHRRRHDPRGHAGARVHLPHQLQRALTISNQPTEGART